MITRDFAEKLSALLVEEAPNSAVGALMGWMQVLMHREPLLALGIVEKEAEMHRRSAHVGSLTDVLYAKVRDLARQAQRDFEAEQMAARLERVKAHARLTASLPARPRMK